MKIRIAGFIQRVFQYLIMNATLSMSNWTIKSSKIKLRLLGSGLYKPVRLNFNSYQPKPLTQDNLLL